MPRRTLTYRCPFCGTEQDVDADGDDFVVHCSNPECRKPFQAEIPKVAPVVTEADLPPDAEIRRVRLDVLRRYPLRSALYAALLVGGLAAILVGTLRGPTFWTILGVAAFGYAAWRVAVTGARARGTVLTLTTRRLIVQTGMMGTERTEVPVAQIVEIEVHQSRLNQALNVGDLSILWGSTAEPRKLLLMAVPDPESLASEIKRQIPVREPMHTSGTAASTVLAEAVAAVG